MDHPTVTKPAAVELPHYVPPQKTLCRVTLTTPIEPRATDWLFLGEYEGDPVRVSIGGADAIRVRHAIRDHGSAIFDVYPSSIQDATPQDLRRAGADYIAPTENERDALLRLNFLKRTGLLRPSEHRP